MDQLPFTANARFKAVRPIEFDGVEYGYDEFIPDGLPVPLLERLYAQRRIYVAGPNDAAPQPKAAKKPEPKSEEPKTEEPKQEDGPLKYRVKHAGLGGFKVIAPNGAPVGAGWKTHAEALAEAKRLSDLEA